MKAIISISKKKIILDEILRIYKLEDYNTLIAFIMQNIEIGTIKPKYSLDDKLIMIKGR